MCISRVYAPKVLLHFVKLFSHSICSFLMHKTIESAKLSQVDKKQLGIIESAETTDIIN